MIVTHNTKILKSALVVNDVVTHLAEFGNADVVAVWWASLIGQSARNHQISKLPSLLGT